MSLLPKGFEPLEPLLERWAFETTDERLIARGTATFGEIRACYDMILPYAERALNHLDGFDIGNLPEPERRLMQLMFALAHCTIAVEVQRSPVVPGVDYPHEIHVIQGLAPLG